MTAHTEFTEKDLDVLDLALTHLRRHDEQLARDFRREPVMESIAQSYDAQAAQAAALLTRIRVRTAIAKAEEDTDAEPAGARHAPSSGAKVDPKNEPSQGRR